MSRRRRNVSQPPPGWRAGSPKRRWDQLTPAHRRGVWRDYERDHPPADLRWPLAPLLAAAGAEHVTGLARMLNMSGTTMRRWRDEGIPDVCADECAVRIGAHPAEIWAGWLEVAS